jgi:GTP-binding protein
VPNLGVIRSGDTVYTMADVPGLIPGASTGKGLGVQFLRHVERCAVLVHVIDMATMEPGRDPESDIEALEHELAEYGGELDLVGRLQIAVLNKIDVPDARELVDLVRASLEKRGLDVFPVSAATGEGLKEFGFALAAHVEAHRASLPTMEPARVTITPKAVDDSGFTVERDPDDDIGFVVRGVRPERWVRQTDFTNDEAVGFLADRLNRLGVEEQLAKAGAREGDAVTIGGVTFDWEPTLPAGTLTVEESAGLGGRGTDARIDAPHRVRAQERLAAKKARRTPYEVSEDGWSDDELPDDAP